MVRRESVQRLGSCRCRDTDAAEWNVHGVEVLSMCLVDVAVFAFRGLEPPQRVGPNGDADVRGDDRGWHVLLEWLLPAPSRAPPPLARAASS